MQGISPLLERTQAGPSLCFSPCSHLYCAAPQPKFRAATSGCSTQSQVKAALLLPCLTQSRLQCHAAGKAAEGVLYCGESCQELLPDGFRRKSLSVTPFLRYTAFTHTFPESPLFGVHSPLLWEETARHPCLLQFLLLASNIRHPVFPIHYHAILPFFQEMEEGERAMGKWGERNIAREMMQWEHSPKSHGWCLGECYHISPLGSCKPYSLKLEHLQQLPEFLREAEEDYHSDTTTEAGYYGGWGMPY